MDQRKDVYDYQSKCSIDISDLIKFAGNEKKKVARRRWAILAKALKSPTGSEPSSPTDEYSVRRISSFMLLQTQQLPSMSVISTDVRLLDQFKKRTWYSYSMQIDDERFSVNVGHRNRTFSAEDLMGFNNTGNICIWPSEETLSYYVCNNLDIFNDKKVLELGGGMSCLAGLYVAKYGRPKSVTLTDGNKISIENVQVTLECNKFDCPVDSKVFKWNDDSFTEWYDVIICADCLFFDDARNDLIDCLWRTLSSDGLALVMAPERGNTLDCFMEQSQKIGFSCRKIVNYNEVVWSKRLALLDNVEFNDNIHYPILIEVTKS
ncbi:calmodulin-lysine N-methyltransferase-like isoform X1 [Coccinella septempunctata]|uniref:calmodulin-lysine N-methyltransferase-like isoform X1 n=2 Tax=Coccinella septempunctata TaxID=41139 RepID=UPI001D0872E6|nr:calmodulin-lysine N-methyltransferase-like isoform X1 [Coccinella septempunctata]